MTSSSETAASNRPGVAQQQPPPLPPRQPSDSTCSPPLPPPPPPPPPPAYSLVEMNPHDPASWSTQSLVPGPETEYAGRRTLLLIYIHGFMGNETSFRSFPAHVHNLVSITLADSHVVHTKIYPKYRSRYALDVARDDFSKWLAPHESSSTDVILLAHSMGGLVAADIALLFRHPILGIINFDVPFVGMHPGIIKAGLTSIFKPWPAPPEASTDTTEASTGSLSGRTNTLFNPKPSDPNYNPSFANDIHLPVRKGWENTLHFINKHSNGLIAASKGLVKSHIEFGSAMADYKELKERYARIRALEEDDEQKRASGNPTVRAPPRIRFVNYYTASTGRPKKPKSPSPSRPSSSGLEQGVDRPTPLTSSSQLALTTQPTESSATGVSPRISVEEHREDGVVQVAAEEPPPATSPTEPALAQTAPTDPPPALPDIPPIPQEPPFVDLAQFSDKTERKAAERQHSSALKEYRRAVKARNAVINQRAKMEERWEKQRRRKRETNSAPRGEKRDSGHTEDEQEVGNVPHREQTDDVETEEAVGAAQLGDTTPSPAAAVNDPYGSYVFSRSRIMAQPQPEDDSSTAHSVAPSSSAAYSASTTTLTTQDTDTSTSAPSPTAVENKRLRKFCALPPKDARGNKDPTWIRVFMEGVDEVTAHTSLFFMSETYERLVGDVGARIEEWVRESDSLRLARELDGL